jgi:hypothetical protein
MTSNPITPIVPPPPMWPIIPLIKPPLIIQPIPWKTASSDGGCLAAEPLLDLS